MSKLSQTSIDHVKSSTNIVDVVSLFVRLERKGPAYIGLCPFHNDRHPSMRVDPVRQMYKCFVCGAGGDVFDFLMRHENFSFIEAVRWCASRAGIQLEETEETQEEIKARKHREALYIAMNAATGWFQNNLPAVSSYLAGRGFSITDEVIKTFRIGYAPQGNNIQKQLQDAGYSADILQEVNIIGKGKYGYYDVFQDRITFPFLDIQGRTVAYSGRIVTPRENTGKYLNTNNTPLFQKGNYLFGLYQAYRSISSQGTAYLVEGQFDVMSLYAAGVKNVVAGSGTALTDAQVKLLSRYTSKVILMYDADAAGLKASIANCESMLRQGLNVSCVRLPEGQDPDNLAQEKKEHTAAWLVNNTCGFVTYFCNIFLPETLEDPVLKEEKLSIISRLVACVETETLRTDYIRTLARRFNQEYDAVERKVKQIRSELPAVPAVETMKPGVYGLDILPDMDTAGKSIHVAGSFDEFLENYETEPQIYFHESVTMQDIQLIRRDCSLLDVNADDLVISASGEECATMAALSECYRNGITNISVLVPGMTIASMTKKKRMADDYIEEEIADEEWIFINAYLYKYNLFMNQYKPVDRTPYLQRCAEMIACTDESVRIVNFSKFTQWMELTKTELNVFLKPYLAKRKSRVAINAQRDDSSEEYYDPDVVPDYVEDNPVYKKMMDDYQFYPRLNKNGEPVGYIFTNNRQGGTLVGDFFMEPLIHIVSDKDEENKRIVKINRRYYKKPIYLEAPSKCFLKKSTIEERLIMLEAVNFSNGEEKHWTKIREWMSRNYTSCREVRTYGNQQPDGFSRDQSTMFFAFANGIYHQQEGIWRFDPVNELGVVEHQNENWYLPAFSSLYINSDMKDKYETISSLMYREIPAEKQCSFEKWADLMNRVYSLNDNGKWAIIFAVMCAFRSNIHCIDRLFTAPFFMGPMSSGKTQIAISIRSLFISPKVPIFNLNIGTDAAMSTLMSTFRDVPVVLDEYNNKDISDVKFQALKGIVYDGDGRQKRKGTSGKEIENDKVFTPVIICGQETPQRDDNALMSRIIVCEVPKPARQRTPEEIALFNELKDIEEQGLCNVLAQILQLRTLVMDHFRELKQECYKELKEQMMAHGEIDRLMKTASLFLATCKMIEQHTELKLPFTYAEFFQIACNKIQFQADLISRTDKLATFFKAMDVMIDTKAIITGRDFDFDYPTSLTLVGPGKTSVPCPVPEGTCVMYIRLSVIYAQFDRSSFNREQSSQSTIEQNLRSNSCYIGPVSARRFTWQESVEVPVGELENSGKDLPPEYTVMGSDSKMVRSMKRFSKNTSCIALNYDALSTMYGIDLKRNIESSDTENKADSNIEKQELPF